ncbi:hypothetical protein BGX38DRAFT_1147303 [Terfezia claveryi]|nr:hypothetical protein BGX38DRAFT_1147303 [Terfezia claveryi]
MSYVHSSSLDNNYLTPDGDSLPAYVATAPPLSSMDLTVANAAILAAHSEARNPAGRTASETIMSLFDNISSTDDSSVAHILSTFPSLVNPNSRQNGKTALVAAVETGNIRMVEMLINMGADVDLWSVQGENCITTRRGKSASGSRGLLAEFEKGGFRRLKYAHATSVYRIKETTKLARMLAACLVWHIPKAVLYRFPKWIAKTAFRIVWHVVTKSIPKAAKATWRGMVKSGRYLRDDLPGAISRKVEGGARAIKKFATVIAPKAAKATGNFLWMLIMKWIPNAIKQTCKFTWKLLTVYIPRTLYEIILSMWDVIKFIGWFINQLVVEWFPTFCKAVANGLKAFAIGSWDLLLRGLGVIASLLHTIFEMIISFFRRISLRDVWNAVLQVLKWVFVEVPVGIGKALKAVYRGVVKGVEKMFGWWGKVLVFFWEALVYAVLYLPVKLGAAFVDYFQVLVKGVKEVLVWFNPKR